MVRSSHPEIDADDLGDVCHWTGLNSHIFRWMINSHLAMDQVTYDFIPYFEWDVSHPFGHDIHRHCDIEIDHRFIVDFPIDSMVVIFHRFL